MLRRTGCCPGTCSTRTLVPNGIWTRMSAGPSGGSLSSARALLTRRLRCLTLAWRNPLRPPRVTLTWRQRRRLTHQARVPATLRTTLPRESSSWCLRGSPRGHGLCRILVARCAGVRTWERSSPITKSGIMCTGTFTVRGATKGFSTALRCGSTRA